MTQRLLPVRFLGHRYDIRPRASPVLGGKPDQIRHGAGDSRWDQYKRGVCGSIFWFRDHRCNPHSKGDGNTGCPLKHTRNDFADKWTPRNLVATAAVRLQEETYDLVHQQRIQKT